MGYEVQVTWRKSPGRLPRILTANFTFLPSPPELLQAFNEDGELPEEMKLLIKNGKYTERRVPIFLP